MRIAITGTRDEAEAEAMRPQLEAAMLSIPEGTAFFILGDAAGIDALAWRIAKKHKLLYVREEASWDLFGKGAGHIRNGVMLDHEPDEVWWWHLDLNKSKGTLNCVRQARERGLVVRKGMEL